MKPHTLFCLRDANLILVFFLALIVAPISVLGQHDNSKIKSTSDYFYGYHGWYGHPDSIKVWIDPNFTEEQKEEIRIAIARWNAENPYPKYVKTTSTDDAQVHIFRNDNLPTRGDCQNMLYEVPDGNYIIHSWIQINTTTTGITVTEIATHELGHPQGVKESQESDDAMYGGSASNGNDGVLTDEDKMELARAKARSLMPVTLDWAEAPAEAILPGVLATINFDLTGYYPPEIISGCVVEVLPFYDPLLSVEYTVLTDEFLEVGVITDITHPNCAMGLIVNLFPPEPYESVSFIGVHYINNAPVPPMEFECPFVVHEENGNVQIDWTELCTYPFEGELRSELVVDDSMSYVNKGGGNYTIQLEPGNHFFELFVDDFQVNSAYFSQYFIVTGLTDREIEHSHMEINPNPFIGSTIFKYKLENPGFVTLIIFNHIRQQITVLLDEQQNRGEQQVTWNAEGSPSGIYFYRFTAGNQSYTGKMVVVR